MKRDQGVEHTRLDVSDVKKVRWTVLTIGVTQSKEYGAGGCAARHGRLCDGDRMPAGRRYSPFHACRRGKGSRIGWREMRVFAAPRRKLDEIEVEVASHKEMARTPKRCSCHFLMVELCVVS